MSGASRVGLSSYRSAQESYQLDIAHQCTCRQSTVRLPEPRLDSRSWSASLPDRTAVRCPLVVLLALLFDSYLISSQTEERESRLSVARWLRPIPRPHEPQPLQRELLIHRCDRAGMRGDQLRESSGRDDRCVGRAELIADAVDDRIDLTCEAVDEP